MTKRCEGWGVMAFGVVLCMLLSFGAAHGQAIAWKTPGPGCPAKMDPAAALRDGGGRHLVVQFGSPVKAAQRRALPANGIVLLDSLGANAYFARVKGGDATASAGLKAGVASAFEVAVDWKLHPRVASGDLPEYAVIPGSAAQPAKGAGAPDLAALCVIFHRDVTVAAEGADAVLRHGGEVRGSIQSINAAMVWLPVAAIEDFAREDVVQWIEPPLPPLSETNNSNRVITQVATVQEAPYSLDGTGVHVLVFDAGTARASHEDFGGRLTVRDNSGMIDHATHVSGTIGGSGSASGGLYRGMAPGVTIESYGFEESGVGQWLYTNPGDIESDYNEAIYTYGAEISNNSIGTNVAWNGFPCEWEGDYGATAILLDSIVRGALGDPFRIVWAAGNERGGACGDQYHLTAPPANAKNHITVGALNSNNDTMTSFSSWGPSDDGRLKPDISGPGCQSDDDGGVTSCDDTGDSAYTTMCGTSMAAPTVTGISALILQEWKSLYPAEALPRNSTLKVLLAHNAVDLGNPGPDYQFGYGSVRAQDTIDFLRGGAVAELPVEQGEDKLFFVNVEAGASALKVTVAWDDYPGTPNTAPELVNDLDVVAISPAQDTYYPWTLDPENPANNAVRTQADRANNIEQVVVDSPAAGKWTIRVTGYAVPEGPQVFSIATSPEFSTATSAGVLVLNSDTYACDSSVRITVSDTDLNADPNTEETVAVSIVSNSEPAGESVLLTETGPDSSTFRSMLSLSSTDSVGVLMVANGDTVTASYLDADDGSGGANITRTDAAAVDCAAPVISNVAAGNIGAKRATITFDTTEASAGTVHYGLAADSLTESASAIGLRTSHGIALSGLSPLTTYYYAVEVRDAVGNTATDDGGGAYTFTTPEQPEFFTEIFDGDFDLSDTTIYLFPDGSSNFYNACINPAEGFPVDPAPGTPLSLGDDDSTAVELSGGAQVSLYGSDYGTMYVNSNGNISFTEEDYYYGGSLEVHFEQPRIAALFDDLDPSSGGAVSWMQLTDQVVVTFEDVPHYGGGGLVNFQIQMYFDGTLAITHLTSVTYGGITGISEGLGQSLDFESTDFISLPMCQWDELVITPYARFDSAGCMGEPFPDCAEYLLTNTGVVPLNWTAEADVAWLEITPSSTQIPVGEDLAVQVCFNVQAEALPADVYLGVVTFTNTGTAYAQARKIQVTVDDTPPSPMDPEPADAATDVLPYPDLRWTGGASVSLTTSYDVYFGPDAGALTLAAEDLSNTTYFPGVLDESATYYWKVVAKNGCGEVESAVWSFTTGACVSPEAPVSPAPAMDATDVLVTSILRWNSTLDDAKAVKQAGASWELTGFVPAVKGSHGAAAPVSNVAIFEDAYPWGLDTNESILDANGISYTVFGSSDMGSADLSAFDKVLIASAQPAAFYDALEANAIWFEDYVAAGGVMELHTACYSSNPIYGRLLPGGFVVGAGFSDTIGILDATHPIFNTPNVVSEADLQGWNSSAHGYFSAMPAGASALAQNGDAAAACCAEAFLGAGAILVTTQTVEWSGASLAYLENLLLYGGLAGGHCPKRYDVYLGTDSGAMGLVAENCAVSMVNPGQFEGETTYYWQVVAKNCCGETPGPVWSFTTGICSPPPALSVASPADTANDVWPNTDLSWIGGDVPDCPTTYDVYLGAEPGSLALECSGTTETTCDLDALDSESTYYWKVVAHNCCGDTESAVWSFTTIACTAPDQPNTPYPANAATDVPLSLQLSWAGGGAGDCPTTYDIYLGPGSGELYLVSSGLTDPVYDLSDLSGSQTVYWRVKAENCCGSATGPVWSFTTMASEEGEGGGDLPLPTYPVDFCQAFDDTVVAAQALLPLLPADIQALINQMVCATSDINGGLDDDDLPQPNGMLDGAYELGVIGAVLNDASFSLPNGLNHADVVAAYENNYGRLLKAIQDSDYGSLIPILAPGLDVGLSTILGGFCVEGDDVTFTSITLLLDLVWDIGGVPPSPSELVRMAEYFGPDGDADGDGCTNRAEYDAYAGAGATVYVANALDAATHPPACGTEGEGEGEGEGTTPGHHSADQNGDSLINLSELLRVIQFFNSDGYHCDAAGEDGYNPGPGDRASCTYHQSDYNPADWDVNLSELLRLIQFFNSAGYHPCPGEGTEDGYCVGASR